MNVILPIVYLADLILNVVFGFVLGFIGLLSIPFILMFGLGDFPN